MHRHPSIRDNKVRAFDGFHRVALDHDIRTLGTRLLNEHLLGIKRLWPGKGQIKPELPCRMGKARKHIVAVARPDDLFARDRPTLFLEGDDIGHDLARMGCGR